MTALMSQTTNVLSVDGNGKVLLKEDTLSVLSEDLREKVLTIIEGIDLEDTQAVIQFGSSAQSGISSFSDTLLSEVKTKDTGHVGEALSRLMLDLKDVDVEGLTEKNLLTNLFGGFKKKIQKFIVNYEKIGINIDHIVADLDKSKMMLLKDLKILDGLYEKNMEYLQHLDTYIIAGKLKLEVMEDQLLPQMHQKAMDSGDPLDAQAYKDMEQMANRFEKKIYDLTLSRMIAIQTAPQIRLIQNNNQLLVEKIQSSIMNTIPLWKSQIVIAIALFRQEDALKRQEDVTKTTNELLLKNSELLKDNTIRVAKESERGIVEIETLKKVHNDLIQTIEETMQIQSEGRANRQAAEIEIQKLESDLKNKLIQITHS